MTTPKIDTVELARDLLRRLEPQIHEVIRQMVLSPGGDKYDYTGPTSAVDACQQICQDIFEWEIDFDPDDAFAIDDDPTDPGQPSSSRNPTG